MSIVSFSVNLICYKDFNYNLLVCMGVCIVLCDDDSGFSFWNDVGSVNGGDDDHRHDCYGLLGHSGWDGGFAVGYGANSDVSCDGVKSGNRGRLLKSHSSNVW